MEQSLELFFWPRDSKSLVTHSEFAAMCEAAKAAAAAKAAVVRAVEKQTKKRKHRAQNCEQVSCVRASEWLAC